MIEITHHATQNPVSVDLLREGAGLHRLFEEQADRAPAATAAVFELDELTYGELERRANRLARHLMRLGVGPEVRVGLRLGRSLEMLVAVLAVLKAGGVLVPFDSAGPALVVVDAGHRREAGSLPDGVRVLDLDADRVRIAAESAERPEAARRLIERPPDPGFTERDVWALVDDPGHGSFDETVWGALAFGGRLVIVPEEVSRSPRELSELLSAEKVTMPPARKTTDEEVVARLWTELLGVAWVGVDEDVFAIGAHSLLATRMAWRLRETFGVELPLRTLFEEPTPAGLARRIAEARAAQDEGPPLRPVPRTGELPLSFAQQRLWFEDQLEPGSPLYNMPAMLRLRGPLDAAAVERAFTEVARRHEALRTTFPATRGRPRQEIFPPMPFRLPRIDLASLPAERREAEALALGRAEARRPFDLAAGPLLRGVLVRLDVDDHSLIVDMHHIVSDGWSAGVLVEELGALYGAFSAGRPAPLSELPVQYADFAVWQREQLAGGALESQLAWWRRTLSGAPPVLDLPADRPRPAVRGTRGAEVPIAIAPDLTQALTRLGRREGATLFMTMLAAFQALLCRETGEEDLSVGTPFAGRARKETEGLIGFFVNTLVVRTDLQGTPSFGALVGRVRQAVLGVAAHQDLPFERLVEDLVPQRDPARTQLFQVLFALHDRAPDAAELPGLETATVHLPAETTKTDLALTLTGGPAGLAGWIDYSTDLFDRTTMQRLARRFERLVRAAVEAPETPVDALPLLAPEERQQVAVEWAADTRAAYPRELCIHELFEEQAARTPDLPAVSGDGLRLTYAELSRRARRLARHLAACGVGPDAPVAVLLERSPDLVVTLLAILEAGGAYVPLDPAYPAERLAFMLADSGARVLIAEALPEGLVVGEGVVVSSLKSFKSLTSLRSFSSPEQLAFTLYTSGSTGRPKGVGIPHRAVVRLVFGSSHTRLGPGDRVALTSNISFDAATFEIWGALLSGAELVVAPAYRTSLEELGEFLERERITVFLPTTSLFNQLVDGPLLQLAGVRQILTGGEVISPAHVGKLAAALPAGHQVLCCYGPTENTTFTSTFAVDSTEPVRAPLPLGRPIANTGVYVLDPLWRLLPVGVAGELCTSGDGLARGYLGRPDLTAERFVPDPFGAPGGRLYRTGDRARWLPDGTLDFLGRLDGQIKLRGFRIEPGEIEAAAVALPGIRQAVVMVQDRRLVAVLVPADGGARDTAAVRTFLRSRLPEHMIPASFVWLDALPLTENGKLDRRALARIEAPAEPGQGGASAPRSPIEEGLAGIWHEVLGVAAAGPDDDFFELGGHSLLATQVVSRVREAFGVELPLRDLFASPRLGDLAARIEEERRRGAGLAAPPVTPVPPDAFPEGLPLSFAQEWMWVAGQLAPEAAAYNAAAAVRLLGPLDPGALAAALREVARRHEILRTRFVADGIGPLQIPDTALVLPVLVADVGALPADRQEREMLLLAMAEAVRPFDLAAGPPARVLLVRRSEEEHLLLLGLHHLVTDGWSAGVLLRETAALYGGTGPLPELPVQYGDYAVWQRRWLTGETLETLVGWWREHLAGPPATLELPADRPDATSSPGGIGARLPWVPDRGQIEALRAIARSRGSTLFAVLLAAFNTLLARFARQDDLVVGTPVANRTRRELEGLIGYFVNDLPLRTRLDGDPAFLELLDRVHETALGAWAHQDLPLQKIVQEVGGGAPLFRAWFQLQNTPWPSLELPGVTLAPVELEAPAATFDLELLTVEVGGGLSGHLVYNRELFRRETAESLLRSFEALIAGIAADPARRLSDLPLLAPGERLALLAEPELSQACLGATPLHRAFEAVAAARSKATAVTFEGESLAYGDLNRRADILARRLRNLGIGPESRVGLSVERSVELVIGIVGILKSGAAYVPLDPDYPRERLDLLQEDARLHALVTREENVLSITRLEPAPKVEREVEPDDLSYVIYTSGSTGRPKGVMVTHRQAARLFEATRSFGFGPDDVWTLFHSYAFDFSVWEIWGALLHGGRLVVVPHPVTRSPEDFLDLLAAEQVTVLNQTPSAFYQLLRAEEARAADAPPFRLRWVIFGGEALEPSRLLPWLDRHGDAQPVLVNMYGITETTVHVTRRPLTRADAETPDSVLGWPLDDLRVALLDPALHALSVGAVGEICVGGGGVARGYLGRPDLTAERFVPDPFGEPGARLYRSGDLARLRSDGELVYLGRADQQLKVRGFRIEPGEVEAALVKHPAVAQAAVFARKLSAEDVRLAACVVVRSVEMPTSAELREHLLALLPEPWVPGLFIPVAALPLTAHGKVDRKALTELADRSDPSDPSDRSDHAAAAPLSPLEEHLATLWAGLLNVDHVGRDDNFFTMGGHSLLVTWIAARVREAFGIPPPMRSFFERPTVGNLAVGVLSELAARLEPGRFEEMFALVEGLPEAEVARLVAEKRGDLTPRPPLPSSLAPRPGEGAPPPGIVPAASVVPRAAASAVPSLDPAWSEVVSVRDVLAILPPPSSTPEPRLRVTTLAFPTRNRPAVLERGVASHAAAAREHGREDLRIAVLDDSPDPAVRDEYRSRLSALRRRFGVEIVYAGREEKLRFADALRAEGIPAEAVAATLLDPENVELTIGTNRNSVLLQTVGEGVVSVDDDTLARGGPPPEPEPGIEILTGTVPGMAFLSAREPGAIRGFATRAEAMAAVDLRTVDLPGVHETLLGREVAGWLRNVDPAAPAVLDRADPAFLRSLESGGRVLVTTNGWVGDCGWRSPIFYMLQTGDSWRRLMRSADFYRTVTASKEIVRFMPRPAVGNAGSFMATMFCGFDNRDLLPPFPPVLWGEDLLYGVTLQLAFPAARAGHLSWIGLHDPIEQRGFWPGEMVRTASGIDHSRLLSALLVDFEPDFSLAPADALRRLGAFLQELGRMEPGAFDELARRRVRERAEAFAADLDARLTDWQGRRGETGAPEAEDLWADDVRRYRDMLLRHAEDPDFAVPLDLLYHREPEEARRLAQRLLVHHGTELIYWPDLIEVVRRLKARGQSLGEVVR
jgi:amino acid adenylation domain-containing protein